MRDECHAVAAHAASQPGSVLGVVEEDVGEDVLPHLQCLRARGLAVVVYVLVFPAVTQVALPTEEADEASFPNEAVALRCFVVVFVNLGKPVGEMVLLMVDGMREGELDKLEFGKDLLHLGQDEFFKSVVVVNVQKASANQVVAKVFGFLCRKEDVAVAGDVEEGVAEDLAAADIDDGVLRLQAHVEVGIAEGDEVGQRGGVGVPVAATVVFEEGELGLGLDRRGVEGCKQQNEGAADLDEAC